MTLEHGMIAPEKKLRRVLVIDDELGPRESLRILLKKQYDVFCADSVAKGLEILRESEPDVIVSDIRMPGQSGIEGLRSIRDINPEIPVIMLTGFGALETAQEAIRLGASDYLKKPFEMKEMLEVIQRNVERSDLVRRREESRRTLEELNRQLLDEMGTKTRLASIGQASAELVHDLRNPMMIILGYVQLLAEELGDATDQTGEKPAETNEYIERIEQNVRQCKDLIESWLDLSRNNTMTLEPTNLAELVKEVVELLHPSAFKAGAVIEYEAPSQAMDILGHGVQLRRALQNLIGNAIDAMPETDGCIRVTCSEQEGRVVVAISDNGQGIEQDKLQKIFEPFFTEKKNGKGTGLGLCITKKIIEEHGGNLEIESVRGKGTRIWFRLPRREQAPQPT